MGATPTAKRDNMRLECEPLLPADNPNPGLDACLGREGDVYEDQAVELDPRAVGLVQVHALLRSLRLPGRALASARITPGQEVRVTSAVRSSSAMYAANLPRLMTFPSLPDLAVNWRWSGSYVIFGN